MVLKPYVETFIGEWVANQIDVFYAVFFARAFHNYCKDIL